MVSTDKVESQNENMATSTQCYYPLHTSVGVIENEEQAMKNVERQ